MLLMRAPPARPRCPPPRVLLSCPRSLIEDGAPSIDVDSIRRPPRSMGREASRVHLQSKPAQRYASTWEPWLGGGELGLLLAACFFLLLLRPCRIGSPWPPVAFHPASLVRPGFGRDAFLHMVVGPGRQIIGPRMAGLMRVWIDVCSTKPKRAQATARSFLKGYACTDPNQSINNASQHTHTHNTPPTNTTTDQIP